eukprot:PhF_6_TR31735/c0_g1_i1/m.46710
MCVFTVIPILLFVTSWLPLINGGNQVQHFCGLTQSSSDCGDGDSCSLTKPCFQNINGLAVNTMNSYLYVFEDHRVRQIDLSIGLDRVSTVAGKYNTDGPLTSNGVSSATFTKLFHGYFAPIARSLFVSDQDEHYIVQINLGAFTVNRYAGSGTEASTIETNKLRLSINIASPKGVAFSRNVLYFCEQTSLKRCPSDTSMVTNVATKVVSKDCYGIALYKNLLMTTWLAEGCVTSYSAVGADPGRVAFGDCLSETQMSYNVPALFVDCQRSTLYLADKKKNLIRSVNLATGMGTVACGGQLYEVKDGAWKDCATSYLYAPLFVLVFKQYVYIGIGEDENRILIMLVSPQNPSTGMGCQATATQLFSRTKIKSSDKSRSLKKIDC